MAKERGEKVEGRKEPGVKVNESIKCPDCEFTTNTWHKINKHRTEVHSRLFHCSECGKSFMTRSFLNLHLREVHEGVRSGFVEESQTDISLEQLII